ncbi:ribonuclease H2 subunit A [Phanerochaete sordida]|uniref:Ribonuclease n=1 Tax=Phanerochaete sordida TaxID=48140 RepID=A0A9P3G6A6_9APHY|nr:ribonuclease H2 subunit A [Phanerochaete sordida]
MSEHEGIPSADVSVPLTASYTYHSPKPTTEGPYILGVDEAGRGPALGPLVYGVAYCPAAYQEELEQLGFADSKTLNAQTRSNLLSTLCSDPANLGWSVRVIAPAAISAGMLRRPPHNLNRQSEDATILLIREVLARGVPLAAVYVDALGPTEQWQARLSALFPGVAFTVANKADGKFKIVGAASVAAKVTRDAWIEGWRFEEAGVEEEDGDGVERVVDETQWGGPLGSGYPGDPKTVAWIKSSLEPTFGFPSIVRFSWTTVKVALEKHGHKVDWIDDGQASLTQAFSSAMGRDKDRCAVAKELSIRSVGTL